MSGSFGAQVVLDPASPAAQGARGGAASTIHGNTVARDLGLISNGLDPLLTAGPPNVVVPFSLNFMRPGWLDPGVTFARASTATYTDASGTIQTAAINAPRWDYAGGSLRGLLIEEARTNLFLNSATLVTQGVTVTATAYTLSFYGTGTVTKSGAATGALVGTGAAQRVTQTFTPSAGTVTCTVTGSVTNAQIEAGPFATSWISTAGATVTRAGDFATMPTNASWYNQPASTLFCETIHPATAAVNGHQAMLSLDNGSSNARVQLYRPATSNGVQPLFYVAGGLVYAPTLTGLIPDAVTKTAVSWRAGAQLTALNGVTGGADTQAGVPAAATVLNIGGVDGGTHINGYMRRIQYWPRALSAAEMQAVTT